MSARALVAGCLYKAPESRLTKDGRPYIIITIREEVGEVARYWRGFVFGEEAIEEIRRLDAAGEPVAVAGPFEASIYTPPNGEPRVSWRITVDGVLNARSKAEEAVAPRRG